MVAVLQRSLEQTISREDFEDAARGIRSVPHADCALLQRELYGIVVRELPRDDAFAFQAALSAHSFPTDVVDESTLPVLPAPTRETALRLTPAGLVLVDLYGREKLFGNDAFVFS